MRNPRIMKAKRRVPLFDRAIAAGFSMEIAHGRAANALRRRSSAKKKYDAGGDKQHAIDGEPLLEAKANEYTPRGRA